MILQNFIKVKETYYDKNENKTKLCSSVRFVNPYLIESVNPSGKIKVEGVTYNYYNLMMTTFGIFGCVSEELDLVFGSTK